MNSDNNSEILNKLEKWLVNHRFIIFSKQVNPNPQLIFNVSTHLPGDLKFYLNISLFKSTSNYLLLNRDLRFDRASVKSIDTLPKGEREKLFMNMRKLVYPLLVNISMKWPEMILLTRELTITSIQDNEQLFIDQVRNLRNAVELVKITFDEKHFELFPRGKKNSDDFR